MKNKTRLIVDASHICYRAFHTTGHLKNGDIPTGTLYGFFHTMQNLADQFNTTQFAFCFDYGKKRVREKMSKQYKSGRTKKLATLTLDELNARIEMRKQVDTLREKILPRIGFTNVFWQDGYEADDIIASVCLNHKWPQDPEKADYQLIIVSGDKDLHQLITEKVSCYDPIKKKITNLKSFKEEWGVPPSMWSTVKAIAGCSSDSICGVYGVAEKTAAKFLRGELDNAKKKDIEEFLKTHAYIQNKKLVTLPLEGTNVFTMKYQGIDEDAWAETMERLSFVSLKRPIGVKPRDRKN